MAAVAETLAAWNAYTSALQAQGVPAAAPHGQAFGGAAALQALLRQGHAQLLTDYLLQQLQAVLQAEHIPCFWSRHCSNTTDSGMPEFATNLLAALQELCTAVEGQQQLLASLACELMSAAAAAAPGTANCLISLRQRYNSSIGPLLLAAQPKDMTPAQETLKVVPLTLAGLLRQLYAMQLEMMSDVYEGEVSDGHLAGETNSVACQGDGPQPMDACYPSHACEHWMGEPWAEELAATSAAIRALGLEHVNCEAYSAMVTVDLRKHLAEETSHVLGGSVLGAAQAYVAHVPLELLRLCLPTGAEGERQLQEWRGRLTYSVYETLGRLRMGQMFDIVKEFPESSPAIADVRQCLASTNLHRRFVAEFRAATRQRMLHAGALTSHIISQYVSTIKALRQADPSGVLLEAVGEPIREYLRCRKDTIRCIVTMLTDDNADGADGGGESLVDELGRNAEEPQELDGVVPDESDEAALAAADNWEPDPIDADPGHGGGSRGADIITLLVGIYGSKELFINEYRLMLAERLLSKADYECEREVRTLELLKLRFGEAALLPAEIMLKDFADSKRINANIHNLPPGATSPIKPTSAAGNGRAEKEEAPAVSASIVSGLFWPPSRQEDLTLPPQVQTMLDKYAAKYHALKAPRKLQWRPHLGAVALAVTAADGSASGFSVTPAHAAVLMQLSGREELRLAELAAAVGLAPAAARSKALFWVNHGVLTEARGSSAPDDFMYRPAASLETASRASATGAGAMDDDAAPGGAASAADQAGADMAVYESFIMGMLTNFEAGVPADRIHNMLKMFVSDPPYDRSAEQLGAFLGRLVAEEKLLVEGGVYRKRSVARGGEA